jgi:hypothetical protein
VSSVDFSDALWRKSSYSNGQANCVETAAIGQDSRLVAVCDSKAPAGPRTRAKHLKVPGESLRFPGRVFRRGSNWKTCGV